MLSIIIINYNVKFFIKECINSILESIELGNYEIIVVDNYSYDGSVEMLKNEFSNLKIIENPKNLGFSAAVNIGIKNSSGDYICLINPDTLIKEDTLKVLKKYLINNLDVGIVGCKVLDSNGKLQLSSRRSFPTLFSLFNKYFGLSKIFPKSNFFSKYNQTFISEDKIQSVDAISGACMMFNKKIIDIVGYFDERFFLYFEDTDYCLRIIEAGFKVIYNPKTQIIHYNKQSSQNASFEVNNVYNKSLLQFYRKYKKKYSFNFITNIVFNLAVFIRKLFFSIYSYRKKIVASILDLFSIIVSFLISILFWYTFQYNQELNSINFVKHWPLLLTYICVWYLSGYYIKLYGKNKFSYGASLLNSIISFFIGTTMVYFISTFAFSRAILLIASFFISLSTSIWRIIIHYLHKYSKFSSSFINHYLFAKNALILDFNINNEKIRDKLLNRPDLNYSFIGYLEDKVINDSNNLIFSKFENINQIIKKYKINEIIIPESRKNISSIIEFIQKHKGLNHIEYKFISTNNRQIISKDYIDSIGNVNLIDVEYILFNNIQIRIKRIFDIILSMMLITALSPLILYGFSFKKIEQRYKWGMNNKKITIYKLNSSNLFISEIPLLLSIFKGDLSFVGSLLIDYKDRRPNLIIKPGITGLSKQKFNNKNKLINKRYDEYYIQNYSLIFDIEIILKSLLRL